MIVAAKISGNRFTKAVLNLPNLQFRHVTMPNQTTMGVPITAYAHKSDFVRLHAMAKYGGQYFDDDSWVIRDLAPLRKAGFENVFGKEWGDDICQAMWMSTPGNALMKAFERLQETEFNGEWLRASNNLISNLVYDVSGFGHDKYALVLERNAFFPGQWNIEDDGLPMFYKVHPEPEPLQEMAPVAKSIDELVNNYSFERRFGWKKDWRNSYVIHGFSNAIRGADAWWMFGEFKGFTPEYVLSQSSNIGRALYPALQNALDTGVLKLGEEMPAGISSPP
ncbi:hypothetical protein CBS101457_003079 [Exobasidium rhododendri]|nr:hypothetical protein CBS101457_003079 [Exobasidium rhododendri]